MPPHALSTAAAPARRLLDVGLGATGAGAALDAAARGLDVVAVDAHDLAFGTTVHALAAHDPRLAEPVLPGQPVTHADLLWAARYEGALDEADLLDRRTRIGLVPEDRAAALKAARAALDRAAAAPA
ncbi:FAD-dependent oxidoreductase [Streptomyces sp. NPDC102462]|uniref:FAD-dependent oxidoreductase n=1 Tax=Streptomyces sp. NPDC102462 TaxID=3366178 RepID=UPI0037F24BC2